MAAVSVSELRKRFDKAANGNVFSEFDNWRQNQADIVEEAAKAAAATPTKTGLKVTSIPLFMIDRLSGLIRTFISVANGYSY